MKTSKLIKTLIPVVGLLTFNLVAVAEDPVISQLQTLTAAGITPENPLSSYKVSEDGVSKDGLTWQRCLVGQTFDKDACTGAATEYKNWEEALNAVTEEQQKQGWRVANIKELVRMVETTKAYPALDSAVFPFAKSLQFSIDGGYRPLPRDPSAAYIWSSTPVAHKIAYKDISTTLTIEESKKETDKNRENVILAWALDLGLGEPTFAYRDGTSKGDHENTQYSKPDPDKVMKARYVLLVKDAK